MERGGEIRLRWSLTAAEALEGETSSGELAGRLDRRQDDGPNPELMLPRVCEKASMCIVQRACAILLN